MAAKHPGDAGNNQNLMIPYGKQSIDKDDIEAVVEVLRSDWLTTGPKVAEFEGVFARYTGAKFAVAVSSGTAALHAAMFALGIGPGDEVIVTPMTFAASANCIVYQGGTPVFADVEPDTLLIDPNEVEAKLTERTKAIIAVDYTGQPCNYDRLQMISNNYNIPLVADVCHSLGGRYKNRSVGSLALLNTFSFHPVKHITTGEGGMITTNDPELANKMLIFRNHGITTDHRQRENQESWFYEMVDLGYNYRITDFQCALGMSQLKKLPLWVDRRREIAHHYDAALGGSPGVKPLFVKSDIFHAYHLYVVRLKIDDFQIDRDRVFHLLRRAGVGAHVHYIPVHLHPFYQKKFNMKPGLCPVAEEAYKQIISLPIYPGMSKEDIEMVLDVLNEACRLEK
jgi:perosamine synthetase